MIHSRIPSSVKSFWCAWTVSEFSGFRLGNFTSQDFDTPLHSFCAASSSPQISAILGGHFTGWKLVSAYLRKTSTRLRRTNFRNSPLPKFALRKFPTSESPKRLSDKAREIPHFRSPRSGGVRSAAEGGAEPGLATGRK